MRRGERSNLVAQDDVSPSSAVHPPQGYGGRGLLRSTGAGQKLKPLRPQFGTKHHGNLPHDGNSVSGELAILGNHRETALFGLRDNQPVERVCVVKRKLAHAVNVSRLDGKQKEAVLSEQIPPAER